MYFLKDDEWLIKYAVILLVGVVHCEMLRQVVDSILWHFNDWFNLKLFNLFLAIRWIEYKCFPNIVSQESFHACTDQDEIYARVLRQCGPSMVATPVPCILRNKLDRWCWCPDMTGSVCIVIPIWLGNFNRYIHSNFEVVEVDISIVVARILSPWVPSEPRHVLLSTHLNALSRIGYYRNSCLCI